MTITLLTLALVLLTAYYAWQTRLTVLEMRASRVMEDGRRRDERRKRAARELLQELRGNRLLREGRDFRDDKLPDVAAFADAVEDYTFELDATPELQQRLEILRYLAIYTPHLPAEGGLTVTGISSCAIYASVVADDLRAYLLGHPLSAANPNFPAHAEAVRGWLIARARQESWDVQQRTQADTD